MSKTRFRVLLFCLFVSMALVSNVEAARGGRPDRGASAKEQQSLISRERAASIARSATGGRVLKIRLERGKRPQYRVKVLLGEKRVRSIGVDARSGAILK